MTYKIKPIGFDTRIPRHVELFDKASSIQNLSEFCRDAIEAYDGSLTKDRVLVENGELILMNGHSYMYDPDMPKVVLQSFSRTYVTINYPNNFPFVAYRKDFVKQVIKNEALNEND